MLKVVARTLVVSVLAATGLLASATPSAAQATAQISGTVHDASGAVLPGASITATQTDTGTTRSTVANESGFYTLPSLPLGPYKLNTGVNISVAGATAHSVQYNLDGASHLDLYAGTNMPLPFPDMLQEFRLVTGNQEASSGGHAGASVNAVTKSGTNTFRGDGFWFGRFSELNGQDPFQPQKDGLKRNQFGGTVGGPLLRNKVFFFAGYQGTTTRQAPLATQSFVPTAAMRTGDFSAYLANNCPGAANLGRGVFGPGVVANGRLTLPLSPAAVAVASRLPQTNNPCGAVFSGNILHENQHQIPLRVDYQRGKNTIFARYLITTDTVAMPYSLSPNDLLTTSGNGRDDRAQSAAGGVTSVLTANLVNSVRV